MITIATCPEKVSENHKDGSLSRVSDWNIKHDFGIVRLILGCPEWSRFEGIDISDPYKYSETIVNSPQFQQLWRNWKSNLDVPFYGLTNDGRKKKGLYHLQDEGAPTRQMVTGNSACDVEIHMLTILETEAARKVVASLSQSEKEVALRDLDTEDW